MTTCLDYCSSHLLDLLLPHFLLIFYFVPPIIHSPNSSLNITKQISDLVPLLLHLEWNTYFPVKNFLKFLHFLTLSYLSEIFIYHHLRTWSVLLFHKFPKFVLTSETLHLWYSLPETPSSSRSSCDGCFHNTNLRSLPTSSLSCHSHCPEIVMFTCLYLLFTSSN
jgi:hypothetical protein